MKIKLIVDAARGFRWQSALADRLRAAGHAVAWERIAGARPWPMAVDLVLDLESLVYRRSGPCLADRITLEHRRPADAFEGAPDLVLDLSGRGGEAEHIRPLYDGSPDPAAAVAALLDGRAPRLDLALGGASLESGLPANENPAVLVSGLDAVFARVVDLCCRVVARHALGLEPARTTPPPARSGAGQGSGVGVARFAVANLAAKARARLTRQATAPEAWRIGYRGLNGPGILETGTVPEFGFAWLPDDGARYYADPFILLHAGRIWVFCEEFPYATGKGVISVFEIGPDGSAGTPRVVLEASCHLSYPFVFKEGGEIWMIPESSTAADLALYRAVEFPWRWHRERTLIEGPWLSDATPVHHDGRLWLFAALNTPGGSSWDALGLYHAPDLFGDFVPHPLNPVLVDAGSARPGGRMFRQAGKLMRIAQDCRAGYGAGAAIARVDRLDERDYRQTLTRILAPPAAWGASGLHTIETGGGFEAIDCFSAATLPA